MINRRRHTARTPGWRVKERHGRALSLSTSWARGRRLRDEWGTPGAWPGTAQAGWRRTPSPAQAHSPDRSTRRRMRKNGRHHQPSCSTRGGRLPARTPRGRPAIRAHGQGAGPKRSRDGMLPSDHHNTEVRHLAPTGHHRQSPCVGTTAHREQAISGWTYLLTPGRLTRPINQMPRSQPPCPSASTQRPEPPGRPP